MGGIALVKAIEDVRHGGAVHAAALVRYPDHSFVRARGAPFLSCATAVERQAHAPAVRRELHGVVEQVQPQLRQVVRVAGNGAGVKVQVDADVLFLKLRL